MTSGLGFEADAGAAARPSWVLFSESPGRAVVSFAPAEEEAIRGAAAAHGIPMSILGRVGGSRLRIVSGDTWIDEGLEDLTRLWREAFRRSLESADLL